MRTVIIQYRVKPDQVERHHELLHAYFDELGTVRPAGVGDAAFQLNDKVSFIHIVEVEHGPEPFARLPAFQRYRSTLDERCVGPPVMTELIVVGAFGFQAET